MKSSITCLSISTPLTGVRNTGDKSDPNFESNDMVLWESGEKDATPATFDKDKELQLIAKVNFSEAADYAGKALSLEATFVPHKYYPDDLHVDGTSRFTLPENHDSIEMDVVFTLAHRSPVYENLETPWGLLGGGLTFTVTASPDMSQSMGTVPIELYGIIGKLFQQFSDEGIPKDLLLTWVMPTLMHGVKTEKEWIKWAVNR